MTSSNDRSRVVKTLLTRLRKSYGSAGKPPHLAVLEHLVLAILSENTDPELASQAFQRLKEGYFDWNEVRVAAVKELRTVLSELPDVEQRCKRLKKALKHVFESVYSFEIDSWRKLTKKEAVRHLSGLPFPSQYVTARVIRDGLGGAAVPLDSNSERVLRRLRLFDDATKADAMTASLERLVPKSKCFEFTQLLARLGNEICLETEPHCTRCFMLEDCPTGQEIKAARQQARRQARKTAAKKRPQPKSRAAKVKKKTKRAK